MRSMFECKSLILLAENTSILNKMFSSISCKNKCIKCYFALFKKYKYNCRNQYSYTVFSAKKMFQITNHIYFLKLLLAFGISPFPKTKIHFSRPFFQVIFDFKYIWLKRTRRLPLPNTWRYFIFGEPLAPRILCRLFRLWPGLLLLSKWKTQHGESVGECCSSALATCCWQQTVELFFFFARDFLGFFFSHVLFRPGKKKKKCEKNTQNIGFVFCDMANSE